MLRQYTLLLGLCAFSMSCSQQGGTAVNEGLADPQKSSVCSIKLSEPNT